jgi:hypothetical protein
VCGEIAHGFLQRIEALAELLSQHCFLLPALRLPRIQRLQFEHLTDDGLRNLKLGGEDGQILIELGRESQQLATVVFQERAYRLEPMRTKGHAGFEFGEEEIKESAAVAVGKRGDGEDIAAQPTFQQSDIVGQGNRLGGRLRCRRDLAAQGPDLGHRRRDFPGK